MAIQFLIKIILIFDYFSAGPMARASAQFLPFDYTHKRPKSSIVIKLFITIFSA